MPGDMETEALTFRAVPGGGDADEITNKKKKKKKKDHPRKKQQREHEEGSRNKKEEEKQNDHTGEEEVQKEEEEEEEKDGEAKSQQQHINMNNSKKRKKKNAFPYGNYSGYYGYRHGNQMDEDPRLRVMKREWFEGKDCLDIGCNSGVVTIQVAKKFGCKSILGIDIDSDRIKDANWKLRKFFRAEQTNYASRKAPRLEITEKVNDSEHIATPASGERKGISSNTSHSEKRDLLEIVSFEQENFVTSQRPSEKRYDTILCLSVTKWVHLNWGDDGLITLFSKIWKLLRPGGVLVLEPQPWKSYKSNRLASETTAKIYGTIMFHPELFREILLDKIGFRMVEDLTLGLSGAAAGFDRPIFAFHK